MKFGIEVKNSKLYINWEDVKADCYKIYAKINGHYTECASVSNSTFTTISNLPVGENECIVKAVKNGIVIDKTPPTFFEIENPDGICFFTDNGYVSLLSSEQFGIDGYRLYKAVDGPNYSGVQNTDKNGLTMRPEQGASYKLKTYKNTKGQREIVSSTKELFPADNMFESATIYKSYEGRMFLSWIYKGWADGFFVYPMDGDYPVFETNDGLSHFAYLDKMFHIYFYKISHSKGLIFSLLWCLYWKNYLILLKRLLLALPLIKMYISL